MRFFLPKSEHESLTQAANNWNAVVKTAVAMTEGMNAKDVTPDVITELLNAEPSGTNSEALNNATNRIKELEGQLNDAIVQLDAIDPTVKAATSFEDKVTAINAKLAKRAGVRAELPQGESGNNDTPKDGADWDAINGLKHNLEADKI